MFDFMDFDCAPTDPLPETGGPFIPEAGECLRCGLCVSSCPTFRLFQIDAETPRRRIRTISKLLVENLPITADEKLHLDNCVQCRACEAICPSHMAYGQLFDQTRITQHKQPGRLAALGFWLIAHKRWRYRLLPLLLAYLKSGVQKPLRFSGLLNKLGLAAAEALISTPSLRPPVKNHKAKTAQHGTVAIFTGCLAEHFDRQTLQAGIELLNAIGFEVLIPREQGCCGAIHQHNGQSAEALITNNIDVFNALPVDAVLHMASGCGVMLSEYPYANDEATALFKQRLQDINDFLLQNWPDDLKLQTCSKRVAVHEPCSQRNVLKNQNSVYALLEKIPGLNCAPLADNQLCCGAGGSYLLSHPENAGRLRELKWQVIREARADTVVSSNFGCAVYLNVGNTKVVHPLVLLAAQLPSLTS